MGSKYLDLYRVLGVEPGCSWTELKLAYRRLVRRLHPDHRHNDLDPTDDAEIKAVNTAFEALSDYYQEFGELPLAQPEPNTKSSVDETVMPPSPGPTLSTRNWPERLRFSRYPYLLFGAALAIAYAIVTNVITGTESVSEEKRQPAPTWHTSLASPTDSTDSNSPSNKNRSREQPKYFLPGSTIGEVIAAQGPPTKMENNIWHYGESRVHFRDGRVTHWDENEANPLKARLVATASVPSNATHFGIGSTKADVRAAQGSPMLETDTMWDYGNSRVYFKNGRVTSWEESPVRPLRLRR